MELAERLVNLRKERGLTQTEVAEKVNVSRQIVSKWETGDRAPGRNNLKALSELYGVSIDSLLSSDGEIQQAQKTVHNTPVAVPPVQGEVKFNPWKKRILYAVTILLIVFGSLAVLSHRNSRDISEEKTMPIENLHIETDDGEDIETFCFDVPFAED